MVLLAGKFISRVTLQTDATAGLAQLLTVWIMAIAAGYPGMVHAALQERTVDVHFLFNLAVRKVHALIKQAWQVMIQQRFAMHIARRDDAATRMAARAHLYLDTALAGLAALRRASGDLRLPVYPVAFVQQHGQSLAGCQFLPAGFFVRPVKMLRTGSMAGLAGYIDL